MSKLHGFRQKKKGSKINYFKDAFVETIRYIKGTKSIIIKVAFYETIRYKKTGISGFISPRCLVFLF